ncbi:hypothetical protein X769_00050 [Mesorhizobium sp. LSJC268A00]|nr:hypothetical protein X769_00050 [Mesorhizobium sp. LSJC268A00]
MRYANQLPDQIERLIVESKREKPHWRARKIRELLVRRLAGDVRIPARSTVHAVLDRHGLVSQARKRNRANKAVGTQLSQAVVPNDLWCADFKGEFKLGNRQYCYPLTESNRRPSVYKTVGRFTGRSDRGSASSLRDCSRGHPSEAFNAARDCGLIPAIASTTQPSPLG